MMSCCSGDENGGGHHHLPGYTGIQYNTRSHLSVIFQRHGSVWPSVLPYCILNVILTIFCRKYVYQFLEAHNVILSGSGHSRSTFVVSFFVVSRCTLALKRNDEAYANLFKMTSSIRELISSITVSTSSDITTTAKSYRNNVAYHACIMLRLAVSSIDYQESNNNNDDALLPWMLPELNTELKIKLKKYNHVITSDETNTIGGINDSVNSVVKQYAHASRTLREEIYRCPIIMGHLLKLTIAQHKMCLSEPMHPLSITRTNGLIDKFFDGYLGQVKLLAYPLPFPLLQMARTLMFVWVLTLPLSFQATDESTISHCITVFFLTYAFLGLEVLSVELEYPFGSSGGENSLGSMGLALTIFEDVYAMIDMNDGMEWAHKLRMKMSGRGNENGGGNNAACVIPTESLPLMIT